MAWLIPAFFSKLLFPKCVFTNLPDELLVEVLALLEVTEILKIRQICRRFDACTRDTVLWRRVVLRMAHDCALSALPSMSRMSNKQLENLAIRHIRAKQRMEKGLSERIELRSRQVPICVSSCHLVPGGQWFIASTWGHEIYCWDLDNWATKGPILLVGPDDAKDIRGCPSTAIDYHSSGKCILAVARLHVDGFKIEVYSLDIAQATPHISLLGTIAPSEGYGTVLISGSYITRVQNMKSPVIETFNWEQCLSQQRFDYAVISFFPRPSRFVGTSSNLPPPANLLFQVQPKRLLSNEFLICNTRKEIFVFRLGDFQSVTRLGEIGPTPTVPYWWYTPDALRIPTWPAPATFSPSNAHLQRSSFVCSMFYTCYSGYACQIFIQNGEPAVQWIRFDPHSDFVELGCNSGFRISEGHISSFRASSDSLAHTKPVRLDMGELTSNILRSCYFDEFSGRSCFARCGATDSWVALLDFAE